MAHLVRALEDALQALLGLLLELLYGLELWGSLLRCRQPEINGKRGLTFLLRLRTFFANGSNAPSPAGVGGTEP